MRLVSLTTIAVTLGVISAIKVLSEPVPAAIVANVKPLPQQAPPIAVVAVKAPTPSQAPLVKEEESSPIQVVADTKPAKKSHQIDCAQCQGTGKVKCEHCGGSGKMAAPALGHHEDKPTADEDEGHEHRQPVRQLFQRFRERRGGGGGILRGRRGGC